MTSKVNPIELAFQAANAHGVDPNQALALMQIESGGNPSAVSSANAIGLMQVMPATFAAEGGKNINDPYENVSVGTGYYKKLLDEFGDPVLAVGAYNAGPGRMRAYLNGQAQLPAETVNHMQKWEARYKALSGQADPDPTDPMWDKIGSLAAQSAVNRSVDPAQMMLPGGEKRLSEKALDLAGVISGLGGAAASAISAIKGGDSTAGDASIKLSNNINALAAQNKKDRTEITNYNSFLADPTIPKNARLASGYAARGVPNTVIPDLLPGAEAEKSLDLRTKELNLEGRRLGNLQQNLELASGLRKYQEGDKTNLQKESEFLVKLADELDGMSAQGLQNTPEYKTKEKFYKSKLKQEESPARLAMMTSTVGTLNTTLINQTQTIGMLEKLEGLISQLPEGRISGNLNEALFQIRPDSDLAEVNQLQTYMRGPVARQVMLERGALTNEDVTSAMKTIFDSGYSKQERQAILANLHRSLENSAKSTAIEMDLTLKRFPEDDPTRVEFSDDPRLKYFLEKRAAEKKVDYSPILDFSSVPDVSKKKVSDALSKHGGVKK